MNDNGDSAKVLVFPPVLYLGALLLGLILHVLIPLPWHPPEWPSRFAGVVLLLAGLILARAAQAALRRAGTNVRPDQPTTAIVRDGPFRYSRNPLYLATTLLYAGMALIIPALWTLLLLVPLLVVLQVGVISREENYLEAKFGADYRSYRATVRRWL